MTASLISGIALAVALGLAVPLATNSLAALGLRATVDAIPPVAQDIQLTRLAQPFNTGLQQRIRRSLGDLLQSDYTLGYTPYLGGVRQSPPLEMTLRLRTQSGIEDHIRVEGRLPRDHQAAAGCEGRGAIEALLSLQQIRTHGLAVGDQLCVKDRQRSKSPARSRPSASRTLTGSTTTDSSMASR